MTAPQLVTGVARAANWALAALLVAAAAGSLSRLGVTWLGATAAALYLVLGLGALSRNALGYLAIATLSFLSLAAAMQHGDFVVAALNGAAVAHAQLVGSPLRIPRARQPGAWQ